MRREAGGSCRVAAAEPDRNLIPDQGDASNANIVFIKAANTSEMGFEVAVHSIQERFQ